MTIRRRFRANHVICWILRLIDQLGPITRRIHVQTIGPMSVLGRSALSFLATFAATTFPFALEKIRLGHWIMGAFRSRMLSQALPTLMHRVPSCWTPPTCTSCFASSLIVCTANVVSCAVHHIFAVLHVVMSASAIRVSWAMLRCCWCWWLWLHHSAWSGPRVSCTWRQGICSDLCVSVNNVLESTDLREN